MTDRIFAYTVVLDRDIREDDAEAVTRAIAMIKGVATVEPIVADAHTLAARYVAREEARLMILEVWRRLGEK